MQEIRRLPLGRAILDQTDVVVAGRYAATRHFGIGLLGSTNQAIHFLTRRYTPENVAQTPKGEARIDARGNIQISGVSPPGAPPVRRAPAATLSEANYATAAVGELASDEATVKSTAESSGE